jgi:glycosyltransferase involved in cell wall biosynthesis
LNFPAKKRLKILILNSLNIYGGGEFFVLELASYLKSRGHDVWAGCKKDSPVFEKCRNSGIRTAEFNFPKKGTGKLRKNIAHITDFIKQNKIDIVHSNTNYDRTAGAVAAQLAGISHVASVHSLQSISHNLTHWARNKFLVDMFAADGNIVKDFLVNEDKIDEKKIKVINLGIDPESMEHDERLRKNARNEFGLADSEVLIGNLGRLVEFKGQDKLIKAFKQVLEKFPNVKLLIVGDGERKTELKNLVQALSINEKVIFAGFRDDLQAVYSAFDIYAHTSSDSGGELFPFAVLYAMAAGLPVVSTGVGEIPSMIKEDISGFITGQNDDEISSKIITLLGDLAVSKKMGEEGKTLLNQKFTLEKMGSEILKLYEHVLSIRNA